MYNGPQRKNLRLKNYDYSEIGYYFVTICCKNKQEFFGEIVDGKMILNEFGEIAKNILLNLGKYYKNFILDEYIFMPNHFHGIFIIVGNGLNPFQENIEIKEEMGEEDLRNGLRPFPTKDKKHGLSQIVASFKSFSTREIRKNFQNFEFGWQKSFFDVIIKNENQLLKTREYIFNNPLKREFDVNNPKNEEIVKKLKENK